MPGALAAGLGFALVLGAQGAFADGVSGDFALRREGDTVSFVRPDGSAWGALRRLPPVAALPSTKLYAQHVMDSLRGWDLKPVIELRGFSFKYVDNAPCAGLVTYFDGRTCLLFQACGNVSATELSSLFSRAGEALQLPQTLRRQAEPERY